MSNWPLTTEAAGQFLLPLKSAQAVMILTRPKGGSWVAALQQGPISSDQAIESLSDFDAEAGGTVVPTKEGAGWLARYCAATAQLEICVLVRFAQVPPQDLHPVLEQLEERTGWILVAALRDLEAQEGHSSTQTDTVLSILLESAHAPNRAALARQWIARLEKAYQPDAVVVVDLSGISPSLLALSGGAEGKKSEEREALEAIAQLLQDRALPFHVSQDPQSREALPNYLMQALLPQMKALGVEGCLALPVSAQEHLQMAVLLLWKEQGAALPALAQDTLVSTLSDSLAIHHAGHPSLLQRMRNWFAGVVGMVFGKRAWKLKLALCAMALILLAMALIPAPARPAFTAHLETEERRVIVAPWEGYLSQAPYRIGDLIAKGEIVLAMDNAELLLQRAALEAETASLAARMRLERAKGDIAQLRSLEADLRQSEARLSLIDHQIEQSQTRFEHDVQVLAGNAHERIGARLRQGEALLEVGNPDTMAITALIDEAWVADLHGGMQGELVLAAWPDQPMAVRLERISADAQFYQGQNAFRSQLVFATEPPAALKAALLEGMRGVVRIEAGASTLLANYTRGIRRWWQALLWRMG